MVSRIAKHKLFQSPELRVVEASAGSGKTYALAKRYVQLVLDPSVSIEHIPIRNILALTFTNKAAFEMKARILEFLKKTALKTLSASQQEDILRPLGLDPDQASLRAYAVMDGIIRHYNFFQVQTIDKFINALLSGCAFKIGLTANFKIKTNSGEYLQYSLDQLIDRAGKDQRILKIFEQFIHHYLYLENRSGWFPKDDMLAIITTLFGQANTYGMAYKEGPITGEDVIQTKRTILENMRSLQETLPEKTHAGFCKSLNNFLDGHTVAFDIDRVSDYFARDVFPVTKGGQVPSKVVKLWQKIGDHLKRLCAQEAYSLFNPYIQVYAQAMEGFYALAAKDDCLFLSELNSRAGLLFDEDRITVEELYYRLATRFHHYLIDEFQDTSRLQWHNLEKMVEEGLSQGGTLFYVGDRKQAIFGFRGGDAGLFDDIQQTFKPFNVRTDRLTNNWRSQKAVVEFNNAVFSVDNLARFIRDKEAFEQSKKTKDQIDFTDDDIAGIKKIFENAQQTYQKENTGGYVQLEYITSAKKEGRNEIIRDKVIDLIRDLKDRFSYRDIAILTRSNHEIKEITNWLLEAGIPVESERTSDITENRSVQEIVAFLRFLNSPVDNLAFTEFILSDIFAAATGLAKEEMHLFIFSLRSRIAGEKDLYVYTEFRKKYNQVWAGFIEEFFLNVGLYPLYETVVTVYGRYNVLVHCRDHQGFLMHFLELVKGAEEDHRDIQSFLEYFDGLTGEDLYVHITDSDAVKIMTVHKSKGLEFPVVILPSLGMNIQIGSKSRDHQPSYIAQQHADGIELLRIKKKYFKFSVELEDIYAREYKKAVLNELNNFYVALTRPQYELYGFIPNKISQSLNWAPFLIPEEQFCRGKKQEYPTLRVKDASVIDIAPGEYPNWIDYLKDEFCDVNVIKNRQRRLRGEIMHYALERIGNLSQGDRTRMIKIALEETEQQFARFEEWPECRARLKEMLEHKDMQPYFMCGDAQVYTEKEVVNAAGHTRRCDRLIIYNDEVWVVDFKSAHDPEGSYHEQITEYKDILREIYKSNAIKGFLIYFDGLEVEEV